MTKLQFVGKESPEHNKDKQEGLARRIVISPVTSAKNTKLHRWGEERKTPATNRGTQSACLQC